MSVITIIGAGMMGSALAFPAAENGHEVRLTGTPLDREIIESARRTNRHPKFDRDFPSGVTFWQFDEAAAALQGADLLIGGVSSFGVSWFGEAVLPLVPAGLPILSVTKGLIADAGGALICYPRLWRRQLAELGKSNPVCAIGGPCTSYELAAHDQSLVAFAGEDADLLLRLKKMLTTGYYHVIPSLDLDGVEAAVALKNGYALAIAMTIGENIRRSGNENEIHYNSQAAAFLQASVEMRRLVLMLGGTEKSFLIGTGDLYVTVYGGRTRKAGILLGKGLNIDEVMTALQGVTLESLVVARRVAEFIRRQIAAGAVPAADFPLLLHVDDILERKAPVNIPWESFAVGVLPAEDNCDGR